MYNGITSRISHDKMMQPPTKYRAAIAKTRIVITQRWRDEFVDILLGEYTTFKSIRTQDRFLYQQNNPRKQTILSTGHSPL